MPAHRRASSVGRYTPVVGEPGDITESFTSSAMTPSMRRLSTGFSGSTTVNVGHTNANVEGLEDEDDGYYEADEVMYGSRGRKKRNGEKDGLVASDDSSMRSSSRRGAGAGAAWRSVDGSRYRRGSVQSRKWSLRAGLLTLLLAGGAVGGITYFVILRPEKSPDSAAASSDRSWWHQFELDDYVPTWLQASSSRNSTIYSTEDLYYDGAQTTQRESSWSSALDAIIDRPTASVALGRLARPTATAVPSEKDAPTFRPVEENVADNDDDLRDDLSSSSGSKSWSVAGLGHFAENVGEEVMQMADNGTLSAYKWHATLPALVTASTAKTDAGRLIVVGDVHGTRRSLVSLLHGVSYSTSRDTLVHTGDILTKSSLDDSLRTIALLRQYGARGVRGNNDQKVLEWRKWMEAFGPMPLPARSSSARSGKAASMRHAAGFKADYRPIRGGAPKIGGHNAPAPRRQKRAWLDWFTSDEQGETGSRTTEDSTTQEELDEEMYVDDEQITPTPAKTRPTTGAKSASSLDPTADGMAAGADRSWKSRPNSSGRLASTPVDQGGDLLGPEYAYLSSDLSASERQDLGLVVPEGWEWGSEHFELAKRLTTADIEYLESLPLTLWIDEIKSWVVHAGMVPWASLRKTLARVSSASSSRSSRQKHLPDLLESTSDLAFEPSSALARQLADASTRTALLLEQPNTDPFNLLNMRTLSLPKGSSHAFSSVGNDWIVSSKGRKASKGSQPWWKAWETGMQQCANKADEDEPCEEAGVIYGHWAGQGLTVQKHSVGLDSGCVYGRRLSALVVPLGASPTSSPLGNVLYQQNTTSDSSASDFEEPEPLSDDAQDSDATQEGDAPMSTATTKARPASRPDWHGGLDRVKVPVSGAAKLTAGKDRLDSSTTTDSYEASTDDEESSGSSLSDSTAVSDDDSEETLEKDAPWWRPWKRAPPQGRPGVAPWHSAVASLDSVRASALSTESPPSDADAPVETSRGSRYLKKLHAATKQQHKVDDPDAEDEQDSSSPSSSLSSSKSSTRRERFEEEQIKLAQAPDIRAWVVSVDCAGELAYQS